MPAGRRAGKRVTVVSRSLLRGLDLAVRRSGPIVLAVDGRVGAPLRLTSTDLLALDTDIGRRARADRGDGGDGSIALFDLLGLARLSGDAELIVARTATGRSFVTPVGAAVAGGFLEWSASRSLRLVVPGWTTDDDPPRVATLRAITFEEFVACR